MAYWHKACHMWITLRAAAWTAGAEKSARQLRSLGVVLVYVKGGSSLPLEIAKQKTLALSNVPFLMSSKSLLLA